MTTYRLHCKVCGITYDIDHDQGRKRETCSDKCKQSAYRERKRNADLLRYPPPVNATFYQYRNDPDLHDALMYIWARFGEKAAQLAAEFGIAVARKIRERKEQTNA